MRLATADCVGHASWPAFVSGIRSRMKQFSFVAAAAAVVVVVVFVFVVAAQKLG